jgi:hypothetical protein
MSDSARQLLPFVAIAAQLFILAKVDNLNLQVIEQQITFHHKAQSFSL